MTMTHEVTLTDAPAHVPAPEKPKIENLVITSGTVSEQRADLLLRFGNKTKHAMGRSTKGPLDAIANAIHEILGREATLVRWKGSSDREGSGAEGSVTIWVMIDGKKIRSVAKGTDTNLTFAGAYLGVFNRD